MAILTGYFPNTDSQADEFLHSHFVATIATVDRSGIPNQSVIYYAFEPDSANIYFLTHSNSPKLYHLKHNPHISILITEIDQMQTYEIFGETEIITESNQIDTWTKTIFSRVKHSPRPNYLPILERPQSDFSLIKIIPEQWIWAQFAVSNEQKQSL